MVNAQQWLDREYPKERRNEITNLDISSKELESSLKLENFVNLTYLNCFNNQLTEIDFSSLNPEKIKVLNIANNSLSSQNLTFLANFINLEELYIHNNNQSKIDRGIINHWSGSLEPLKNMNKLKKLEISQTDLENGLEHLPDSLEIIWCYCGQRPNSLCRSMYEQLKKYEDGGHQDFRAWRADKKNQELKEINDLIFPNQSYNFNQLKSEITRLKHQDLAPQARNRRTELEQLTVQAKNKVETNFAGIIDLLLETQKQITEQGSNELLQGQLIAYQNILQTKLTNEELQNLLNKQTKLFNLEKHLESLQSEQVAQIVHNPPK